jgi:hypothetical protein
VRSILIAAICFLVIPSHASARALRLGLEGGGNFSTLDGRARDLMGGQTHSRAMPMVAVLGERSLSSRLSLTSAIRYSQLGERSSLRLVNNEVVWREESVEQTLGGGIGARLRVAGPAFVSVGSELTYLLAGKSTRSGLYSGGTVHEYSYASGSDRWNGMVRIGVGSRWPMAGGTGLLDVRYVRGIHEVTRITPPVVYPVDAAGTVADYFPGPPNVTEWRIEGVELAAGFQW